MGYVSLLIFSGVRAAAVSLKQKTSELGKMFPLNNDSTFKNSTQTKKSTIKKNCTLPRMVVLLIPENDLCARGRRMVGTMRLLMHAWDQLSCIYDHRSVAYKLGKL